MSCAMVHERSTLNKLEFFRRLPSADGTHSLSRLASLTFWSVDPSLRLRPRDNRLRSCALPRPEDAPGNFDARPQKVVMPQAVFTVLMSCSSRIAGSTACLAVCRNHAGIRSDASGPPSPRPDCWWKTARSHR